MNNEIMRLRSNIILLCPDNDSEAHMILKLAEKANIATIRSLQPHGAKLELESNLDSKLANFKKHEVWIVEIPGIETENKLLSEGYNVKIIDHHAHDDYDRLTDPITGKKKPSSLEQFIQMAKISEEEIKSWGFDPKIVKGIGIMDARYIIGLRQENYTKDEINKVLELHDNFLKEIQPDYELLQKTAKENWDNRTKWNQYLIIKATQDIGGMRSAISRISIIHEMDTIPMIISVKNGKNISVQNIDQKTVEKLQKNIRGGNETYIFGSGRCWGVDNGVKGNWITIEDIMKVLEK